MSIIAAVSNIQTYYPHEMIFQAGKFLAISLIICLILTLLMSNSGHWNRRMSDIFDMRSTPFLITFTAIILYEIISLW